MNRGAASGGGQTRRDFPEFGLPLPRLMLAHHPGPPNHLPNLRLFECLVASDGFNSLLCFLKNYQIIHECLLKSDDYLDILSHSL